jgi:hypothetical protein
VNPYPDAQHAEKNAPNMSISAYQHNSSSLTYPDLPLGSIPQRTIEHEDSSTNQFASKIGQVEIAQQTLTLQGTIEHSSNSKLPTMKQSHSQLELQQTVKSHPSSTKGEVRIRRPGPPEIKSAKRSVSLQRE